MKNDYTILIFSCDSYSDVWPYLVQTFDRFWKDCPFEIFLVSETKDFKHSRIKNLKIGRRVCWSDMVIEALEQISTPNIIYMQEDYLLKSDIDNEKIFHYLRDFEHHQAAYLRLFPWPNPDHKATGRDDLGYISHLSHYRTSLQCAVWSKTILQKILVKGESGWDFEAYSNVRTKDIDHHFLSIWADVDYATMNNGHYPIDYFATGVLHGKWMREAIYYFHKIGIKIKPGNRGVLTSWDYWLREKKKDQDFKMNLSHRLYNSVLSSSFFKTIHNQLISFKANFK